MGEAACRRSVECYRRQQTTTTDAREQNNTGPL